MSNQPEIDVSDKRVFIYVLIATSIAFIWVLLPFATPILWGCILAVLFQPIHRKLVSVTHGREGLSAVCTLIIAILILVIPLSLIASSLVAESADFYKKFESGEISISQYIDKITAAFPLVQNKLESINIHIDDIKEQLRALITSIANLVTKQSLAIGQNTLSFLLNLCLMLYLTYFLLKDGQLIIKWIKIAFPLDDDREAHLFAKFSEVSRATVKGNLVVGLVQGALGGLIFWYLGVQPAILWAAAMAVASLIPAVGTGLIWVPVAIYMLAVGRYVDGVVLIAFGVFVIGLVDNILRPILVGRDTKLPDYVVLFSTLGGLALVGLQGIVVGPLVAALFFSLWNMFVLEFNPEGARSLETDGEVEEWEREKRNGSQPTIIVDHRDKGESD